MTAAPVVSVKDVRKAFGRGASAVFALDRVSLDVAPGEFVALLGASGCGKSTLLSLIAGLDEPSAGSIAVAGDGAALMPQEGGLFPWLTAGRNVELALRLRGMGRSERRTEAERLLGLVRLEGAYGKRPHELSGGMRQRVALARALAQQRQVLLMDEPFSALDAITRDALHTELVRLWEETGLAVVFVTHNVREAVRLGQRVVLLSSRPGRVLREWQVDLPQPRRIESEGVSRLAGEITEHLSAEIRRHASANGAGSSRTEEPLDVRR
ncbi:NitT/TauT family transport system ATP-binding protein [Motilibacter peucedani]|uniref:NitT/TauT family transport system ATP-binding protein n=1 Tax=Motilibacter peucedani TaxID=598650 RepID=A0A420XSB3_9ACTN|nr:ABC transporter ATP-binding protein [Motilibacter peucedani]RKS77699.1 NitT/TauT family transport system ATP-binding protein [Motilibacter peucedani]